MSHAVRYITYGIAVAILLTFVYVAIEQTVQDWRAKRRERERRYYQAPSRRPGYLPPDTFEQIIEANWPEHRKTRR